MAGVEWSGCKCKGGTEAKGKMLHFDKEQRLKHGHNNPDIDLSKTADNFSYYGRSFAQKCRKYDEQVESAKVKLQRTGKNANTTMIGLVIYLPKALQRMMNMTRRSLGHGLRMSGIFSRRSTGMTFWKWTFMWTRCIHTRKPERRNGNGHVSMVTLP